MYIFTNQINELNSGIVDSTVSTKLFLKLTKKQLFIYSTYCNIEISHFQFSLQKQFTLSLMLAKILQNFSFISI